MTHTLAHVITYDGDELVMTTDFGMKVSIYTAHPWSNANPFRGQEVETYSSCCAGTVAQGETARWAERAVAYLCEACGADVKDYFAAELYDGMDEELHHILERLAEEYVDPLTAQLVAGVLIAHIMELVLAGPGAWSEGTIALLEPARG